MKRRASTLSAATALALVISAGATAQTGPQRANVPSMADDWNGAAERSGQPATLDAPPPPMPRDGTSGFASIYAGLRSPRVAVLWNRVLTDELETGREAVTEFSASARGSSSLDAHEWATRRGSRTRVDGSQESSTEGTVRSTVNRLDSGRRATPFDEEIDFDLERGFMERMASAGVRLVDRTTIMRAAALKGDTANAQSVEMDALLRNADWTVEVTPMGNDSAPSFKIVVRDLRSGRILAMTASDGKPAQGRMPYVAGPNGFVRAVPTAASPLAQGRQIAADTMAAIARASY